jgi:hypothetical protein
MDVGKAGYSFSSCSVEHSICTAGRTIEGAMKATAEVRFFAPEPRCQTFEEAYSPTPPKSSDSGGGSRTATKDRGYYRGIPETQYTDRFFEIRSTNDTQITLLFPSLQGLSVDFFHFLDGGHR